MADADNATRAPESDAQEDYHASDNVAGAPAVGEHCVTDRPTRMFVLLKLGIEVQECCGLTIIAMGRKSTGEVIKLNDVDVRLYKSKPPWDFNSANAYRFTSPNPPTTLIPHLVFSYS